MKAQAKAKLRYLRMSPRKVRLLVDLIRGMEADKALLQLQFSQKAAARPIKKLLESVIANAVHNHSVEKNSLVVKTAFVDGGPILYRWRPRAFGRASKIRKRTSHVTLIVEGDLAATKKDAEVKEEVVVESTKETVEKKNVAPKKASK
ncbi:MAG: 50S ribosomal protein L22 [Candidatus Magasanikbacteria bacterium]|jgi:large subunit ribosomal protein L22|nr:50S ribosomal protein L22 [Candidatus Magasanikbacteria bacterium]MBT4220790.1 50S ribosomal protein L22 [Candidatus Magasanikbacteria bacterium]MBT4350135.1 50S ribosomal protein L22 [Candidatus Magasanikbacteria bacterium]MBT4541422.1 50S ribosomal protein L22 [Candidatus Magasanikbacteria bacterium]MBT6253138.1 50S ribosomal protein L22 [Candidatus Magasanikbacteria bacterium]